MKAAFAVFSLFLSLSTAQAGVNYDAKIETARLVKSLSQYAGRADINARTTLNDYGFGSQSDLVYFVLERLAANYEYPGISDLASSVNRLVATNSACRDESFVKGSQISLSCWGIALVAAKKSGGAIPAGQ